MAAPPIGNTFATLDLAKVANTILFITSAVHESDKSQRETVIDSWGEEIIQSVISQGLATPIVAITNLESLPMKVVIFIWEMVYSVVIKFFPNALETARS